MTFAFRYFLMVIVIKVLLNLITVRATFINEYLKYLEPHFTILPLKDMVPNSMIPGSKPAKDNILLGLENLEMSPN